MHYKYFLIGEKTILNSYIDESQNPVIVRFNSDKEHVEYHYTYYHETNYNLPLVYPTVSEQAYSSLEWLDESDTKIDGTVSLRFRCKGNDFAGKKANIYIENKLIDTFDIDENGCFGTSYDTTQL